MTPAFLAAACVAATLALVWAEWRDSRVGRALGKIVASTLFIAVALRLGALHSAYGRAILVALLLSWIGDACLLSRRRILFVAGLASFLCAHLAFAAAFCTRAIDPFALLGGAVLIGAVGVAMSYWLWPYLDRFYRFAVTAYVGALIAMGALALGASAGGAGLLVASGALLFVASDVSVARDRFVAPGWINRAWGLPLYYIAQLLLAGSVASASP
jgi:uncharacterized membrane protein YhhN